MAGKRPSILADALEAVIGAVYLDAGYAAAEALVRRLFEDVEMKPALAAAAKDAKTELQELLQGRKMNLPLYRVVGTLGAAHKQTFDVECEVASSGWSSAASAPRAGPANRPPPRPCCWY
jgi:ribonuclease-3